MGFAEFQPLPQDL